MEKGVNALAYIAELCCAQSHTLRFLASPSKCVCKPVPDKSKSLLAKFPKYGHPDDVVIEL